MPMGLMGSAVFCPDKRRSLSTSLSRDEQGYIALIKSKASLPNRN